MAAIVQRLGARRKQRGAVIVWAAFCLAIVAAFLAFSVDYGYLVVTESELQNAADAAALSGARALRQGRDAAIAAAQTWAAKNMAAGKSVATVATDDIEIGLWDDATATFTVLAADAGESPNAVRATCRRAAARGTALQLLFAPLFGVKTADLSATALAAIERNRCGVIVGLDSVDVQNGQIDSYDSSLGNYASQTPKSNGDVCSDGPITIGSTGKINGDANPGAGFTVSDPAKVTGNTTPRTTLIKWNAIDATAVIIDNDNDTLPKWAHKGGQLSVGKQQKLVLSPGTYYFPNGIDIKGGGEIEVSGTTRIVAGKSVDVSGTGFVNTTGLAGNLRIDLTDGTAKFAGNSAFYADIYGPTVAIEVNGNAGFYGSVFGKTVILSGNASSIHGDEALRREYDETSRSTLRQ